MAADYRFLGTNVDTTLTTDASTGAKSFFITELKSYDSVDIMAGIDYEIEEVTENTLIQRAMTLLVGLYRTDARGEVCLVIPGVAAGRFNGSTSRLTVPSITMTNSTTNLYDLPLTFRVTFRLSEADLQLLMQRRQMAIFSTDTSQAANIRFVLTVGKRDEIIATFTISSDNRASFNINGVIDVMADRCNVMEFRIFIESGSVSWQREGYHNGTQFFDGNFAPLGTVATGAFNFEYGALLQGNIRLHYFSGIMRNLVIISNAGTLVDIVDPSAGTNTGSGGDGTPTDVTSVSVIA